LALRTVGAKLVADVSNYANNMRGAARATEGVAEKLDSAARSGDRTARAMEGAGRAGTTAFTLTEHAAKRLDEQIDETARSAAKLRDQLARTGEVGLIDDLAKVERELAKRTAFRDSFRQAGDDSARGFSSAFIGHLGPMMARLPISGPMAAGLAGAAAVAAPLIGAAVAGAVVGGAGLGGIAGGIALAARDPRVKTAGAQLGEFMLGDLQSRAKVFVEPVLDAIGEIRVGFSRMGPDLDRIFGSASKLVEPLTKSLTKAVGSFATGFADAVENSGPVVASIGRMAETLGSAVGDTLSEMSENADAGASAIDDLAGSIGHFVRVSGELVSALAKIKGGLDDMDEGIDSGREFLEDKLTAFAGWLGSEAEFDITADGMSVAERQAAQAARELAKEVGNAAAETDRYGAATRNMTEALNEFVEASVKAFGAETKFGEVMADVTVKAVNQGAGIAANTVKGRENRDMLEKLAGATRDASTALAAHAGGQTRANEIMRAGYNRFVAAATAMGMTKAAARALAIQLGLIPTAKVIRITYPTMSAAEIKARALKAAIDGIDTHKEITIIQNLQTRGVRVSGVTGAGGFTAQRWGGVTEYAQDGLLKDAKVYSPVQPARYGYAEPATGGEAFIPKYGNLQRSRAIWSHVGANWLGMAGGSAGGGAVRVQFDVTGGDEDLKRMIRRMVRVEGRGDVQVAFGRGS
jgi:hypothetical protein